MVSSIRKEAQECANYALTALGEAVSRATWFRLEASRCRASQDMERAVEFWRLAEMAEQNAAQWSGVLSAHRRAWQEFV